MAEGRPRRGSRQRHGPPRPRLRPPAGRGHRRRARPRRGRPRRRARTTRGCTSPASPSSRRRATTAAVGDELATMNRLFPDNAGARAALVQWHLDNGAPDEAEAVLRAAADAAPGRVRPRPRPRPVPARGPRPRGGPRRARRPRRRGADPERDRAPAPPTCAPSPASTSPQGRTDAAIAALRDLVAGMAPAADATPRHRGRPRRDARRDRPGGGERRPRREGARRGPHPRRRAEAPRPRRHRRRPPRRGDPGHAHRR